MLALSQLQSGSVVLHREPLDLAATINDALDVVRPLISQKKLVLNVELPRHLDPISADRTRIRQVILNLLSNAARFTDDGRDHRAGQRTRKAGDHCSRRQRAGHSVAELERIFEPFCQGHEQVWRDKGGSGLGLTISKQFVELHGGRIWLESEVGVGTTFFVSLPLVEARPGPDAL